jgi:2-isopropylmalate synthase
MAGADRVEGTLFGNGERTGNVDVVTLALNLHTQGVDPGIDVFALDAIAADAVHCNRLPIHPRHPYAGELVYTAFSGSHQDAIKKGFADRARRGAGAPWEVPYLPIDPADVGRTYEAVVRINSQSGKGGVAYLLENDHGYRLPRSFQMAMSRVVQTRAESEEAEVDSAAIGALFEAEWLAAGGPLRLLGHDTSRDHEGRARVRAHLELDGVAHIAHGEGVGPVEAFVEALGETVGVRFAVRSYDEHALGGGADAEAVAYVELAGPDGAVALGVGRDPDIETAPLHAIVSAANRALSAVSRPVARSGAAR